MDNKLLFSLFLTTPSESPTSSGVLMSGFFKGLPLESVGFQFYSYDTKYDRKLLNTWLQYEKYDEIMKIDDPL